MKIFIVGSAHPLRGGGISTFNERLAEVLMEEGHDVTIVSFKLQYPSILFPGKSQFTDEPAPPGIKIKSWINSINPLNWLKVGKQIAKERPDMLIVRFWLPFFGPSIGTILKLVQKNKHTKIISVLDNVIPHEHRVGDKPFTQYFLKQIHAGITMSRSVLNDLKALGVHVPAQYTPHPMYDNYHEGIERNKALQHLGLDPSKKYVLFFGFIRKYKGLDLLLKAFGEKALYDSDIELIIAGEYYEDNKPYKDIIEEHQLKNKIHLFDAFIPNADVHYYFSACDIVAQPYRSATQSGISQIAYYYRKPMLVTNVGGLPEIVMNNKTGWVVNVDEQEISKGIMEAFKNESYLKMSEDIESERRRFEWSTFTNVIKELYSKIS